MNSQLHPNGHRFPATLFLPRLCPWQIPRCACWCFVMNSPVQAGFCISGFVLRVQQFHSSKESQGTGKPYSKHQGLEEHHGEALV